MIMVFLKIEINFVYFLYVYCSFFIFYKRRNSLHFPFFYTTFVKYTLWKPESGKRQHGSVVYKLI